MQVRYGRVLTELRKTAELSQGDLAQKLEIGYQAISKWENDTNKPNVDFLKKYAEIFDVSVDALIDGKIVYNKDLPKEVVYVPVATPADDNTLNIKISKRRLLAVALVTILILSSILTWYYVEGAGSYPRKAKLNIDLVVGGTFVEEVGEPYKEGWQRAHYAYVYDGTDKMPTIYWTDRGKVLPTYQIVKPSSHIGYFRGVTQDGEVEECELFYYYSYNNMGKIVFVPIKTPIVINKGTYRISIGNDCYINFDGTYQWGSPYLYSESQTNQTSHESLDFYFHII